MSLLWHWILAYWLGSTQFVSQTTLATSCSSCHPREVASWSHSRHAKAFTNGLFRGEFNRLREAWCASCHAPSAADPHTVSDSDPVALEGVSCVACHVDSSGHFLSTRRSENSPHNTVETPSFATAAACEKCHQFNFPVMGERGMPSHFLALPMQDTVGQFRKSRHAQKGMQCQSCHMKKSDNHLFPGSHNLAFLQSALEIEQCRTSSESFQITITNKGAAHAVPTGGVNRHMVLRSWRSSSPESLNEFFIGRKFYVDDTSKEKTLSMDTTIAAGESRVFEVETKKLGGSPEEPIQTELRYIYPLEEFAELPEGTRRALSVYRVPIALEDLSLCE